MKWSTQDVARYKEAASYVDTVIVPLMPVDFGEDMKSKAAMGEYVNLMTDELERQFHGRVLQLPPFTYMVTAEGEQAVLRLKQWHETAVEAGKQHVIYLTADSSWKKYEEELTGTLLWLPLLPVEDLDPKLKRKTISDQIEQILPIIMEEWKKSPQ
ncbi:uncharacterized protein DUF2487 [Salsuginibacillus halophilus]|uniref:Uncharacterized protein DUF2487 n=1 Tax=Salsuginibacillus halophilus TaxID=517424 RepID=A0A2P8HW98_9BACI|nr:YpiF family protein [Salsuginibacillus halophilus]PSL50509.1 uncharacterized protein DUF2487 [Salsuginibacillus halophilus]